MQKEKLKTQKGITLIALIITIIIMLILVVVTVTVALKGNLFGTAKTATRDTELRKEEELALSNGQVTINRVTYSSIASYLGTQPSSGTAGENGGTTGGGNESGENNSTIILPDEPKVGDYVNYTPEVSSYTVNGITYTTDTSLKWRVLSINESTGKVEKIISDRAVHEYTMKSYAADMYEDPEFTEDPDNMCYALYGGRNINKEDVDVLSEEQRALGLNTDQAFWLSSSVTIRDDEKWDLDYYRTCYQYFWNVDKIGKERMGYYGPHAWDFGYSYTKLIRPVIDV